MESVSILMLEDSLLDAELIKATLRRGGLICRVDRMESRDDFDAALDSGQYDIVLADYVLPSFDGLAALEIARAKCPGVPFIIVSGVMGEEVAVDTLHRGATDYVLKERLERLVPSVRRALEESLLRREKERTVAALEASEQRYRMLVDNVKEYALLMTDSSNRITTWNAGAERLLGYTESEIKGLPPETFFTPEDRQSGVFQTTLEAAARDGRAEYERVLVRRNGTSFWASGTAMAVRHAEGALHGFVHVLRDNSERKSAEEDRRLLLARAQTAREEAEQRALDLAGANEALENSNQELEQFAYAASHDLQEPLRMVNAYAQLLVKKYKGRLDPEADEFLEFVEKGVARMQSLIQDLLSYSRLSYQAEPECLLVNVNAVVDDLLVYLRESVRQSGASITRDDLPQVNGNAEQFHQVFQNLLSNSLKYRNQKPPCIHIAARRAGDAWQFSVFDNGIGFESRHAERIFGLFKRLHRDEYPGTGVGLAICKRIVEQRGGRIWAESTPGEGSTFHFTIPAGKAEG